MILTDAAAARLDAISLLLIVFLAAGGLLRVCWNGFGGPRPMRLAYREALGLGLAWGLITFAATATTGGSHLVPGAWVVRDEGDDPASSGPGAGAADLAPPGDSEPVRLARLARLAAALRRYANRHEGRLPPRVEEAQFDPAAWESADPGGTRFVYVPGGVSGDSSRVVAYEPGLFGPERLVLFADGEIRRLPLDAILAATPEGGR